MMRRDFLTVTAGAAFSPAVASRAAASSPVMMQFSAWKRARSSFHGAGGQPLVERDCDALAGVLSDLEDRLLTTPAECAEDVLLKIAAYTNRGGGCLPSPREFPAFWDEVDRFGGLVG